MAQRPVGGSAGFAEMHSAIGRAAIATGNDVQQTMDYDSIVDGDGEQCDFLPEAGQETLSTVNYTACPLYGLSAPKTSVGRDSSSIQANCSSYTPPNVALVSAIWPAPDSNARNHRPSLIKCPDPLPSTTSDLYRPLNKWPNNLCRRLNRAV